MSLIDFIASYGLLAVLAGTLLEGEMVLLLAGWAAHQGHLSLPLVLLVGFIGGMLGDQLFFWIGCHWGEALLRRLPSVRSRTLVVGELLRRHDAALVFGIRFMYGLRIAGPIAMGALGVPPRRFALFNALGAAAWSGLIGGLGYALGHTLELLLGDIERYENAVAWGLVAVVALGFAVQHVRHVRRARRAVLAAASRPIE